MKKQKGITLVALVVTIIVLIILAGISISLVLRENGIINLAQKARENYIDSETQEQNELEKLYSSMLVATNDDSKITISMEDLDTLINTKVQKALKDNSGQLLFTEADCTFSDAVIVDKCSIQGYKVGNLIHVNFYVPISKLTSSSSDVSKTYALFYLPQEYKSNSLVVVPSIIESYGRPLGVAKAAYFGQYNYVAASTSLSSIPDTTGGVRISGEFTYYLGEE